MIIISGIFDDFRNLPRKHDFSSNKLPRIAFAVVKTLDW